VFEAARRSGVRRVVYASSNHVIGMYEAESAPALYEIDDPRTFDALVPVRPDSLYGASKVFGEALGRLYADRHGMQVVCLRIGAVRDDDDPTNVEAGRPFEPLPELSREDARKRLRAVWLSHRDCAALVQAAIEADVSWAVVYGTSANPRTIWDLEGARELLGYHPRDAAPA
jgi:nucleoside-diphosphate-sugar epimerase